MPEKFTASFASCLNSICQIEVREAANNDRMIPGLALIAPSFSHMLLKRSCAQYHIEVIDGPIVNRHHAQREIAHIGAERGIRCGFWHARSAVDQVMALSAIPSAITN